MSQTTPDVADFRGQWAALYDPIRTDLAQVERILQRELRNRHGYIDGLVKHSFHLGGKRLRPALVLLAAQAVGTVTPAHHTLAAVVEMIHTATLVHDDVLDEATVRRHLPTVNARWDTQSSVLLGDYLFTHAFYLSSTLGTTFACETIGRATNTVCEGELRQVASRGRFDLSEDEYLEIIEAKTASLCACCCRLGAHYAGAAPPLEESLAHFGLELGIAFQIADDVLDLVGHESQTGKSLGTDLEKQKLTLPLIRLLDRLEPHERGDLVAVLSRPGDDRREALNRWLAESDALSYAQEKAADYARRATAHLQGLVPSPALAVLAQLPELVVNRQH